MNTRQGGARPPATVLRFPRSESEPSPPGFPGPKNGIAFEPSQFWSILNTLPVAVLVGLGSDCAEVKGNSAARMLLRAPPGQNLSRSAPESDRPEYEVYSAGRLVSPSELPIQRAAATGKPVTRSECEVRFTNGGTLFLAGHSVPLADETGAVCGSIGAFIDISHSKQLERQNQQLAQDLQRANAELAQLVRDETAERNAIQSRLGRLQRTDALGQLAGGIAHDFNNVLQAVQSAVALVLEQPDDPDRVQRFARVIAASAEQGSAITGRLLAFARGDGAPAETVDPVRLLAGLQEILSHTLGAGIQLRVDAQEGLPALRVDLRYLETVLVNLAVNGRDAMKGNGRLTLGATFHPAGAATPVPAALPSASYVCLSVRDTGAGMTPEVLAQVTEPFFTTKPQGTGLGLTMAHEFAREAGGVLHIDSTPGQGTTVRLWLPAPV